MKSSASVTEKKDDLLRLKMNRTIFKELRSMASENIFTVFKTASLGSKIIQLS
jgi:hypothetical protein